MHTCGNCDYARLHMSRMHKGPTMRCAAPVPLWVNREVNHDDDGWDWVDSSLDASGCGLFSTDGKLASDDRGRVMFLLSAARRLLRHYDNKLAGIVMHVNELRMAIGLWQDEPGEKS